MEACPFVPNGTFREILCVILTIWHKTARVSPRDHIARKCTTLRLRLSRICRPRKRLLWSSPFRSGTAREYQADADSRDSKQS